MSLIIEVIRATNLPNLETFGKIDPYVVLCFQGSKQKTAVKDGTTDPEWQETINFDLDGKQPGVHENIEIYVKDHETIGRNKLIGSSFVPVVNIMQAKQAVELDLQLLDSHQRPTPGNLSLKITYNSPAISKVLDTGPKKDTSNVSKTAPVENEKTAVSEGNLSWQPSGGDQTTSLSFRDLPKKDQKFQVRVKIVEARQLMGTGINPVVRLKVFSEIKQTRVRKNTNAPWYDEQFFFYVQKSLPDVLEEWIDFEVCNSKLLRSDAVIGHFRCDMSLIYSYPSHSLLNKWLILSSSEESVSTVMGYLKVSIALLGPGDECPSMDSLRDGTEDVESNLLWPTGVSLQPAHFRLSLFHLNDLPRMDPNTTKGLRRLLGFGESKKECVDPYTIVSFAGQTITSKIVYSNENPIINQDLSIRFLFPSVCNTLTVVLMDWDRLTEDDIIATTNIHIPFISAAGGDGYLPTFGPCYINFYGTLREYKQFGRDYDEELNKGYIEGCAYRGRALISIHTEVGGYPQYPVSDTPNDDLLRIDAFCRRRKFTLNAIFINATMVSIVDSSVEFEVSLGNFGNKFESGELPSPSSTQPTNSVFDGCCYYYLPWREVKPFVSVNCQWEDIVFRLEALNMLLNIERQIKKQIKSLETSAKSQESKADWSKGLFKMLDELSANCILPLPEAKPGLQSANNLDKLLRERRTRELKEISKAALLLKTRSFDLDSAIEELKDYLETVKLLAVDPQASIPDAIIWMMSNGKRIAYYRIPAHDLLYSEDPLKRGRLCGKNQSIKLHYPGKKNKHGKIPCLLRVKLWLGKQTDNTEWLNMSKDVDLTVFAETYENEVNVMGRWNPKGSLLTRPNFSDVEGLLSLPKEKFNAPEGWRFWGDWFLNPELSMYYDLDAGHKTFIEDVFENQSRLPGGNWISSITNWSNIRGDPVSPRDKTTCPDGWRWDDAWKTDMKRAVDEEGWEYCVEATIGGWNPVEKVYHLCRRRRWVRERSVDPESSTEQYSHEQGDSEGWEYALFFNSRFHAHKRTMDLVRRRRWHRKMIPEAEDIPKLPIFRISNEEENIVQLQAPRMYMMYNEVAKYQLRAYIYQARDLFAGDKSGFSDPYATICFMNQSQMTEKIKQTLCPTWDQTLVFDDVTIYGYSETVQNEPPDIVIEIFDYDQYGEPEFLGSITVKPSVHLTTSSLSLPKLSWHSVFRGNEQGGELLAAFELYLKCGEELPYLPPRRGNCYIVPSGIRPVLQRTGIEVLCWGLRNMKTYELQSVRSPSVEIECGGHVIKSSVIKDLKLHPNFESPILFFDAMLPREDIYMPALNLKVRDHRSFGNRPIVGQSVIKNLQSFLCEPINSDDDFSSSTDDVKHSDTIIDIDTKIQECDIDWWSKYYSSVGDSKKAGKYLKKGYESLSVYSCELEKVKGFNGLSDLLSSFCLSRGKKTDEESEVVGEFKGTFRIYPLPANPTDKLPLKQLRGIPQSVNEEVVVRVYVIRGIELAPKDLNGRADPYIMVKIGKSTKSSVSEYRPNTLNPIFGHMFEMNATLPVQKDLIVSVFDHDTLGKDDLIGHTEIDLENRVLTKYRGFCGLPKQYHLFGPNVWRDTQKPSAILSKLCESNNLPCPKWYESSVLRIGSKQYDIRDFESDDKVLPSSCGPVEERLALYVCHVIGVVPEHVETRGLFNPSLPGLEQGKIQLWVDIFPKSLGPPGLPVDITPRKPNKYVLRCVIYNAHEVIKQETSITGEAMSDVFVRGFFQGFKSYQDTDTHYRCMDGEAMFNWRMCFPFDFLEAEQSVVIAEKEHFWNKDTTVERYPPRLCIQLWDNDLISKNDFLGEIVLDLNILVPPSKNKKNCTLDMLKAHDETNVDQLSENNNQHLPIDLFQRKHVYGYWPCTYKSDEGETLIAGKVEMELQILSLEESVEKPAAIGRNEPNANPVLQVPNRPATSFSWITSPLKSFRYIVWDKYKFHFISLLLIAILVFFVIVFLYSFPGSIADYLVGAD